MRGVKIAPLLRYGIERCMPLLRIPAVQLDVERIQLAFFRHQCQWPDRCIKIQRMEILHDTHDGVLAVASLPQWLADGILRCSEAKQPGSRLVDDVFTDGVCLADVAPGQ